MDRLLIIATAISVHAVLAANKGFDGRVCMTVELLKSSENATRYYECAPLSPEEVTGYQLNDKYLGVWNSRDCPAQHEFDEVKQRCEKKTTMRRQMATCQQNPTSTGCASPCDATNSNPTVGGGCSWLTANLQPDPQSNAYFLQCSPNTAGQSCGEWVRVPCSTGTVYDNSNSVCVPLTINQPSACGNEARPVCSCASATSSPCPGTSSCRQNTCCQSIDNSLAALQPQNYPVPVPMCPGSNVPPLGECNEPCPQYSACTPGIGCCPVPVLNNNNNRPANIQVKLCPGSFSPPVGTCGACPQGSACNPTLNACCPSARQPSTDVMYQVLILCPSGDQPSSQCGNGYACPTGSSCYQGSCCPMQCPNSQTAVGFCSNGGCGSGTCNSVSGTCCQESISLPVCANGQQSNRRCSSDLECGSNMECSNGGCCPRPFCPSGVQAGSRCSGNGQCQGGQACMEGLCCPLPRCPGGIIALATCTRAFDCGRPGVECVNGGCCPLPQCSAGVFAVSRCGSGKSCGSGFSCNKGGCCPLPQCPTGGVALSSCTGGCATGFECSNGGCCPLPICPNGVPATQRCNGMSCGPGRQCENGVCCSIPMCSSGSAAVSMCGGGNMCPMGYVCEGRGCCQEPLPLCPNGGRAASRCNRGSDCPPGYGCSAMGGCCLLSMEPACPQSMNAVCQCSANQACPNGASCNMGTCCASTSVMKFAQVPGTSCSANTQCNGFMSQGSQCVQNVCVCINGAQSNGATCQQMQPTVITLARNGCDNYGSPCRFLLSSARRKPIFAPLTSINETSKPLFFNVAAPRKCIRSVDSDGDSTCLPNEKCIDGKCKAKLWPGEYGCEVDLECSSRCPSTYCEERKSDKEAAQCQCKDGLLLYGRCFAECPRGFHESGAYCVHDSEEEFWKDSDAQDNLKALLNAESGPVARRAYAMMECCLRSADKQISAFVAALLSFIAQVLSALIIQDTSYFFGIITFSLCCHALLFHGIKKRKMSFMVPYLVCQIVCAAYVLGETFNYSRGLSNESSVAGCFYPDVKNLERNKDKGDSDCSSYYWTDLDTFEDYQSDNIQSPFNITCNECRDEFRHYAILVIVSQAAVLVSFILTWNVVLRFVLHLRSEKMRERTHPAPRVSYFNTGMTSADVIPEHPPRPQNAPPIYTEKALAHPTNLSEDGRHQRTDSLPAYEAATTPATAPNDTPIMHADTPTTPEHPTNNQPTRPVTIDDLL
ncbi:unnamed protein product, partial [Mesorhabditis spiculigera]